MKKQPTNLIACVGSTVRTDDGVGYRILQQLQQEDITADYADLGTDIFRLRLYFQKYHQHVIILDALLGDIEPGKVKTFSYSEFKDKLEGKILNAHLLGVVEGLQIMRELDDSLKNTRITFVGITAENIDKGLELTPKVEQAVPVAVKTIKNML